MNQVSTETNVIVKPAKTSLKDAMAAVLDVTKKAKDAVEKAAKQPKEKRDNAKKARAYDIITTMRAAGQNETAILKSLQDELSISYPNAYYYTKRVFAK